MRVRIPIQSMLSVDYVCSTIVVREVQDTDPCLCATSRRTIELQASYARIDIDDYRIWKEPAIVDKLRDILESRFPYDALVGGHQLTIGLMAMKNITQFKQPSWLNHE